LYYFSKVFLPKNIVILDLPALDDVRKSSLVGPVNTLLLRDGTARTKVVGSVEISPIQQHRMQQ